MSVSKTTETVSSIAWTTVAVAVAIYWTGIAIDTIKAHKKLK